MIVQPKEIKNIKIHEGQTVGLTSGCFDLPHFYHLQYLERCHAQCDVLIVGVDADDLILAQKGKAPAMPEHQRTAMIAALRCVDAVFTLRNLKDLQLAGQTAHILFKNNPQIYGQPIIGAETAKLIIIPDIQEIQSTTQLKQKIHATQEQHEHALNKLIEIQSTIELEKQTQKTNNDPINCPNCNIPHCSTCQDTKITFTLEGTQQNCPVCTPSPKPPKCPHCKDTKRIQTTLDFPYTCPHCKPPKCQTCMTTLTKENNPQTQETQYRCKNPHCDGYPHNHTFPTLPSPPLCIFPTLPSPPLCIKCCTPLNNKKQCPNKKCQSPQ